MRTFTPSSLIHRKRQQGAALVVGLVLLTVLTLLAISGMNTATVELQMAGNLQFSQNAFQAAELAIERAMFENEHDTANLPTEPATAVPGSTSDYYEYDVNFDIHKNVTAVPKTGFSMGVGSGFSAYHFDVTGTGTSARNARAVNEQSFFVVGPETTVY